MAIKIKVEKTLSKKISLDEDQVERIKLIQTYLSEQNGYQVSMSSAIDYVIQACEDMIIESDR